MSNLVLLEQQQHIGIITLNRAKAMNALSRELREALEQILDECEKNPTIRLLIITGAGKAFCAGNDLKELASGSEGANVAEAGRTELPAKFAAFSGPIIAAVNGFAITAGFELALACDFIVASEKAIFADTHARVGVLPGWGLSQRLPRIIGMARAKELAFTGNQISAQQACEWGFVNRVVPAEELLPTCLALAHDIAACVPDIVDGYKALIDHGMSLPFDEAIAFEAAAGIASAENTSAEAIAGRKDQVIARGSTSVQHTNKDI